MIIDGKDVTVGMLIKFRTINGLDPNIISGYVIALCDYNVARVYSDVVKYHEEVKESNPTNNNIPDDAKTLSYFVVKNHEDIIESYAVEWVEPTTLEIVEIANDIIIKIYDVPDTETETILKLLRDNGYQALRIG